MTTRKRSDMEQRFAKLRPLKPWVLLLPGVIGIVLALLGGTLAVALGSICLFVTLGLMVYQLPLVWYGLKRLPDWERIQQLEAELGIEPLTPLTPPTSPPPAPPAVTLRANPFARDPALTETLERRSGARPRGWETLHPPPTCRGWVPAFFGGHHWATVRSTPRHGYQQCDGCQQRRLDPRIEDNYFHHPQLVWFEPVDQQWLDGGEWLLPSSAIFAPGQPASGAQRPPPASTEGYLK